MSPSEPSGWTPAALAAAKPHFRGAQTAQPMVNVSTGGLTGSYNYGISTNVLPAPAHAQTFNLAELTSTAAGNQFAAPFVQA